MNINKLFIYIYYLFNYLFKYYLFDYRKTSHIQNTPHCEMH